MVILCKLLWRFSLYWLESLHYWWYHSFLHELLDHLAFLWLYDSISLEFFHLYHLETFHNFYFVVNLNPIQDGLFRGCSRIRGAKRAPLPKIFHTYPTMMKLGTDIPCSTKIQKIYESRDTHPEFCWHQHFFTGNQQILLYQEIQI